jgi:hypothetical protein
VLLPQHGSFAQAAQAVKDGMLAAQASSAANDRLALHFYDASDPVGVLATLDRAAADGATLAIGPLHREAVARFAGAPRLPITTLALNDSEGGRLPPENLYRFALSPEDEAEEVARAAKAKGFSSALVIYPDGDWGRRIARSFIARWEAVGGVVEAGQMYYAETSTFDEPLEKLFQTAQYATSPSGLGTGADLIFFVGTVQALRVFSTARPALCASTTSGGSGASSCLCVSRAGGSRSRSDARGREHRRCTPPIRPSGDFRKIRSPLCRRSEARHPPTVGCASHGSA